MNKNIKIIGCVLVAILMCLVYACRFESPTPIGQDTMYGVWEYEDSAQNIRLKIREDNKVFYMRWYNPCIDSINGNVYYDDFEERVFHSSSVSYDSLKMFDCDKNLSVAIIKEYTDSTLTLEQLEGAQEPICFHMGYKYDRNYDWFMPEDSLDYIIPQKCSKKCLEHCGDDFKVGHQLSKKQMSQVLKLMQFCADRDSVSFECKVKDLYPMNWYIRQYASYINNDGHIMVRVSMTLNIKSEWEYCVANHCTPGIFGYLNTEYISDGGCDYAEAIIDLTTKKVLYFRTHGSA